MSHRPHHRLTSPVRCATRFVSVVLASASAVFVAASAQAAVITWQTPKTIAAGSDVSTDGKQVFGRNIGLATGNPSAIVNGVDFGFNNPNWAVTFSEVGWASNYAANATSQTFGGPDAANYTSVLNTGRFGGTSASFTLGNLTVGTEYLIQFWVDDYRAFNNNRTESISAGGANTNINTPLLAYLDADGPIHGQYVIGTWTADATSITFNVAGNEAVAYSAIQVRAIPEPSTLVAFLIGSVGLLWFARKQWRSARR